MAIPKLCVNQPKKRHWTDLLFKFANMSGDVAEIIEGHHVCSTMESLQGTILAAIRRNNLENMSVIQVNHRLFLVKKPPRGHTNEKVSIVLNAMIAEVIEELNAKMLRFPVTDTDSGYNLGLRASQEIINRIMAGGTMYV